MMRSIRKLLMLVLMLEVGTCCTPVALLGGPGQLTIESLQKLQDPPVPDVVVPPVVYKHKVARMVIHGSVTEISVNFWNSEIEAADKAGNEAMVIDIDSTGGDTAEGFKTAKTIESSRMQIICVVDGLAASEAFYILQSCDKRFMTKRSRLMVHEPYWVKLESVTRKMLKENEHELSVLVNAWMEHAAGRMKLGPKGVIKHCDKVGGDWYMGWEESLQQTAVDGIVQSTPSTWKSLSDKMNVEVINSVK
jgi:ATP-dependent protease ClpP protease subunit